MPELFADPAGNFINSGAVTGLPVKTLQRAIDAANDGDTVWVQNTSDTNPLRLPSFCGKSLTIRAVRPAISLVEVPFYVSSAQDMSHGAISEITAARTVFAGALGTWQTTADFSFDAVDPLYGASSLKISRVTSGAYARNSMDYAGRKVRHRIVYRNTAGAAPYIRMTGYKNAASRYYNFATGAWQLTVPTVADNPLPPSTMWVEYISPWVVTEATDTGHFYVHTDVAGSSTWIREHHLEVMTEWTDAGDGTWYCPFIRGEGTSYGNSYAQDALRAPTNYMAHLFKGATWQDMRVVETTNAAPITEGYCYINTATKRLIYKPVAGEVVTSLHFEKVFGPATLNFTAGTSKVHLPIMQCNDHGMLIKGTSIVDAYDPIERVSSSGGMQNYDTSVARLYRPKSIQPVVSAGDKQYGGGFVCGYGGGAHTATMYLYGAQVINSGDDAFQPADQTSMYIHGATSLNARGNDIEVSFNINGNGRLYVRNFTGYGAHQNGFRDQTLNTGGCLIELTNSAFYTADGLNDMTWTTSAGQANSYTINNVYARTLTRAGTTSDFPVGVVAAVNATITTPPVADAAAGDFTPTAGGAWQGTGTYWFAGLPNPIGADGEPFQNIKPDVGGIQSKHGFFHPSNL